MKAIPEEPMAWTVGALNKLMQPMLPGLLGMTVIEAGSDQVVGTMRVRADMCTAGNILHGGAYMAFADTLGAVATLINMPAGARTATIESKTNFIGAAPVDSVVTGTTRAFHKGKNTQVWQTEIKNADGKMLAVVSQTQMVFPPKA